MTTEARATLVVRNIGALVTGDADLDGPPGVLRNAAVAARDDRIIWVGADAELSRRAMAYDVVEVDAGGAAVIPGFVDAHTHAVWLGDRGDEFALRAGGVSYEELAQRGGGIRATVQATGAGSTADLVAAARPRLRRMLGQGTTTVEIKSGYGVEHDAEVRMLDAAAELAADNALPEVLTTYLPLHSLPDGDRVAFLDSVCHEGVQRAAAAGARYADAFCERGVYTVAECARLFAAAAEHGLRAKLHAEQRSRSGGAALAAAVGAVSADHLEHADDDDLQQLAAAGVVGVLLPGAALVLGGPPPPGRRLLEAGARVAVATDCNPGTCYSESMPLMVALAVATAGLTPAQALLAATSGGAAALGLSDRGRLSPGMRCDLAILDTPHWVDVAYHLGGGVVRTAVVGGQVLT